MISVLIGFALLLLLAWILRGLLHRGLAPERVVETGTPANVGLPYREVRLAANNGKTLSGWYLPPAAPGRAPAVAVLHGWGGNAEMMLPLARPLHDAGFAVLLFDARCHGRSDADSFSSMPRFAEDLAHALDWLAAQPDVDAGRICIVGHSVGAAASLLLASRRDGLAAVVSLAAFAHPRSMMQRWLTAKGLPWQPVGRLILRYVEHVIGHRFDDIAPVTTIGKVRCPTLLVHGSDDATVPAEEASRIYAARGGEHVRLKIIAGGHDDFGSESDIAGEIAEVVQFLQRSAGSSCGGESRAATVGGNRMLDSANIPI